MALGRSWEWPSESLDVDTLTRIGGLVPEEVFDGNLGLEASWEFTW
jgi:hypothetical protein